jgi:DNA polymerase III delta prime subunit
MDTDDRLKYLKELVKASNGQITEQIKEEIIDITRGKEGKKSTDLKKALNSLVGTSNILSGLSKIAIPDIVKDTIENTMDSALDSIKMSFATGFSSFTYFKICKNNSPAFADGIFSIVCIKSEYKIKPFLSVAIM